MDEWRYHETLPWIPKVIASRLNSLITQIWNQNTYLFYSWKTKHQFFFSLAFHSQRKIALMFCWEYYEPRILLSLVLGEQAQPWCQSHFWSWSALQISISNSKSSVCVSTTSVKQTSSGQSPGKLWLLCCGGLSWV